jgi:hypothetical protein
MTSLNHATGRTASLLRRIEALCLSDWRISAYSLIIFSLFLIIMSSLAHGDDLTGLPQDDPKDLQPSAPQTPTSSESQSTGGIQFQPLPSWSRGVVMPALPYQLKPMGKKPVVEVTPPTPAPEPLAPPKDTPATPPSPAPTVTKEKPAPAPAPTDTNPALITVSPFLQWIKSNPQAASEARQEANSYHAGPLPAPDAGSSNSAGNTASSGSTANTITGSTGTDDPYWLPPLIDSSDFETKPVSGSAAIYQTPQR